MVGARILQSVRPWRLAALVGSIPAFYLALAGQRLAGSVLYVLVAAAFVIDLLAHARALRHRLAGAQPGAPQRPQPRQIPRRLACWEGVLAVGALMCAVPLAAPWPLWEWLLQLAMCGLVFLRLAHQAIGWAGPRRLLQTLVLAAVLLAVAGGGFWLLEPQVASYGDGLWLAFVTASTLGYAEVTPSTPGARIFAFFIVVLGYGVLSLATASIAALFIGADEKRLEHELHADIRRLHAEVVALRAELRSAVADRAQERK
jgi:voltage-gated potassium channel